MRCRSGTGGVVAAQQPEPIARALRGAPAARARASRLPPARAPAAARRAAGRSRRPTAPTVGVGREAASPRAPPDRGTGRRPGPGAVGTVDVERLEPDEVLPGGAERHPGGRQRPHPGHEASSSSRSAAHAAATLSQLSKITSACLLARCSRTSRHRSAPRPGTPRAVADGRGHERRLVDRPRSTIQAPSGHSSAAREADLDGHARLAHAAGSGQRHEPSRADPARTRRPVARCGRASDVGGGTRLWPSAGTARTAGNSDGSPSPASWNSRTGSSKSRTRKRPSGIDLVSSSPERRSIVAADSSTCPHVQRT